MSLITQCPACSTMFRVVPDQLRISDGWVRCGHCQEVFDGHTHLCDPQAVPMPMPESFGATDLDADPLAPHDFHDTTDFSTRNAPHESTQITPHGAASDTTDTPSDSATFLRVDDAFPLDLDAPAPTSSPTQEFGATSEPVAPEFEATLVFEAASDSASGLDFPPEPLADPLPPEVRVEPAEQAETAVTAELAEPEFAPVLGAALASEPPRDPALDPDPGLGQLRTPSLDDESADPAADAAPLSFMAAPRPPSRFKGWFGTRSMLLVSVVLLVVLAGQVLVHQRDRLANLGPLARSGLLVLCEGLGCRIEPVKEIDTIAIDSSAFVSVKPGVYQLQVTLKSVAPTEVAVPALELTLTDTQDRPLLRRVIPAESHSPTQAVLAAGGELSIRLPLQLDASVAADKVFGYKLLAFYP